MAVHNRCRRRAAQTHAIGDAESQTTRIGSRLLLFIVFFALLHAHCIAFAGIYRMHIFFAIFYRCEIEAQSTTNLHANTSRGHGIC